MGSVALYTTSPYFIKAFWFFLIILATPLFDLFIRPKDRRENYVDQIVLPHFFHASQACVAVQLLFFNSRSGVSKVQPSKGSNLTPWTGKKETAKKEG